MIYDINEAKVKIAVPNQTHIRYTLPHTVAAWGLHLFTAAGGVVALLAVQAIMTAQFVTAFWWMALAIIIDASDGTIARKLKVKQVLPNFDGAMLDNIIDYINYVFVPAIFVLYSQILPSVIRWPLTCVILLSSAYQFCQQEAKTKDNFFKGFPSYWNIVVFYMFFLELSPWFNASVLCLLALLIFIPIKYVYPSRMENISTSKRLRNLMSLATLVWAVATSGMIWAYPQPAPILLSISFGYVLLYIWVSLYRTWWPIIKHRAKQIKRDRRR